MTDNTVVSLYTSQDSLTELIRQGAIYPMLTQPTHHYAQCRVSSPLQTHNSPLAIIISQGSSAK